MQFWPTILVDDKLARFLDTLALRCLKICWKLVMPGSWVCTGSWGCQGAQRGAPSVKNAKFADDLKLLDSILALPMLLCLCCCHLAC